MIDGKGFASHVGVQAVVRPPGQGFREHRARAEEAGPVGVYLRAQGCVGIEDGTSKSRLRR